MALVQLSLLKSLRLNRAVQAGSRFTVFLGNGKRALRSQSPFQKSAVANGAAGILTRSNLADGKETREIAACSESKRDGSRSGSPANSHSSSRRGQSLSECPQTACPEKRHIGAPWNSHLRRMLAGLRLSRFGGVLDRPATGFGVSSWPRCLPRDGGQYPRDDTPPLRSRGHGDERAFAPRLLLDVVICNSFSMLAPGRRRAVLPIQPHGVHLRRAAGCRQPEGPRDWACQAVKPFCTLLPVPPLRDEAQYRRWRVETRLGGAGASSMGARLSRLRDVGTAPSSGARLPIMARVRYQSMMI
jgi:hypothetical protein